MNKLFFVFCLFLGVLPCAAQKVSVTWNAGDETNVVATKEGDASFTSIINDSYAKGLYVQEPTLLNAADGSEPLFLSYVGNTRQTGKANGYNVAYGVGPHSGHKFKPTKISFDACKVGTDGGNFDVYVKESGGVERSIATGVSPLRNKIVEGSNPNGYSHHEYVVNDMIVDSKSFILMVYFYNLNGADSETPKAFAVRNVKIEGVVDEEIFTASKYVDSFSCFAKTKYGEDSTEVDLTSYIKDVRNGGLVNYPAKVYGDPTDFVVKCKDGYTADVQFSGNVAIVKIFEGGEQQFYFEVKFTVTNREPKKEAVALNRGLVAVSLSGAGMGSGNLVSWRFRENDDQGTKFLLYRGSSKTQTTKVNGGKFIVDKTNFNDPTGTATNYYRLETYDKYGNLISTEVSGKTWANQTMTIKTNTPVDLRNGATYTPNDASFCDMDGDGQYEIILKWAPSNEKDAASNGTTSNPIFDCYKLDGTQLWRIDLGPNFFNSAHTIQFIAWDFDGDGYGEFMCKTGPGTVDGEGNYVLLGTDDPNENLLSSRGKQDHGSEYITVFDGTTGAELSTIPYHTDYKAGESYWGDSKQNRSERYLAALAYLDGPDANPSPIFARGYYSGAFVAAYDWDGSVLKERWVSRNTTSGQGLWGEGAHWLGVGDCDDDGKQELIYGSAALDHDGSLLYRTGLGHGDALHLGDMIPENPGLEVAMCHEHKPYGVDIRDARTGKILQRQQESGDTGRCLAAHFDSSRSDWQFLTSARAQMYNCSDQSENASSWAIGSSGAGINCRIYWDGDLYDEFFDKSIIAHWNHSSKSFDRYKFNGGNYLWGKLNNSTKNNPCVLGDILGDWREEIVTWNEGDNSLNICATSYTSNYRIPHLMDDLNYRVQVVNQNCAYNQPPHLSYDPSVKYKGNPNVAKLENEEDPTSVASPSVTNVNSSENVIYTLQGVKVKNMTSPGVYIVNGKKILKK